MAPAIDLARIEHRRSRMMPLRDYGKTESYLDFLAEYRPYRETGMDA
jgi:hypothetical protein